ncbi:MAG: DUF4939 domain-containing protein, partial [Candidatus Saccharimonadales bacterium]
AISELAGNIRQPEHDGSSRTKVREPEPYDGLDTRKLRIFMMQCQLNFNDRPRAFSTDSAKVNFALSYLKGTALQWFEPAFLDADEDIPWKEDYKEFVTELQTNFGPYDPVGDAEAEIENLRMRDNQ